MQQVPVEGKLRVTWVCRDVNWVSVPTGCPFQLGVRPNWVSIPTGCPSQQGLVSHRESLNKGRNIIVVIRLQSFILESIWLVWSPGVVCVCGVSKKG